MYCAKRHVDPLFSASLKCFSVLCRAWVKATSLAQWGRAKRGALTRASTGLGCGGPAGRSPSSDPREPGIIGQVIQSFGDPTTEHIFYDEDTKRARTIPKALWPIVRRKLWYVHAAATLTDLRVPPGNRLEALKGDRAGQYSIRVNDQFRVCFRWTGTDAEDVEIVDYH